MTLLFKQNKLDKNTDILNEIADLLLNLPWFENVGHRSEETEEKLEAILSLLSVEQYAIDWISKESLKGKLDTVSFGDSKLWDALKDLPTEYKEKIEKRNLKEVWETLLTNVPEHLYHVVFDKAYDLYETEEEVRHLINQAYYMATLITLAKLAGENEMLDKLVALVNTGNAVIGFNGKKIYIL